MNESSHIQHQNFRFRAAIMEAREITNINAARAHIRNQLIAFAQEKKGIPAKQAWEEITHAFIAYCQTAFLRAKPISLSEPVVKDALRNYPGFASYIDQEEGWAGVQCKYTEDEYEYLAMQVTHSTTFHHCEMKKENDAVVPNLRAHITLKRPKNETTYTIEDIRFYHASLAHPERHTQDIRQRINNIKEAVKTRNKFIGQHNFEIRITSPLNKVARLVRPFFTPTKEYEELRDYYLGTLAARTDNQPIMMFNYGVNAGRKRYDEIQNLMNTRSLNETFEQIFKQFGQTTPVSEETEKNRMLLSTKINKLLKGKKVTSTQFLDLLKAHHEREKILLTEYITRWKTTLQFPLDKKNTALYEAFDPILPLIKNNDWRKKNDSYTLPLQLAEIGRLLEHNTEPSKTTNVIIGCIQAMDRTGTIASVWGKHKDTTGAQWAAATAIPGFSQEYLGVTHPHLDKKGNKRELAGTVDLHAIIGHGVPTELKTSFFEKITRWLPFLVPLALSLGIISTATANTDVNKVPETNITTTTNVADPALPSQTKKNEDPASIIPLSPQEKRKNKTGDESGNGDNSLIKNKSTMDVDKNKKHKKKIKDSTLLEKNGLYKTSSAKISTSSATQSPEDVISTSALKDSQPSHSDFPFFGGASSQTKTSLPRSPSTTELSGGKESHSINISTTAGPSMQRRGSTAES